SLLVVLYLLSLSLTATKSTLFPYTTLFRSAERQQVAGGGQRPQQLRQHEAHARPPGGRARTRGRRKALSGQQVIDAVEIGVPGEDRKSTRLNSSHVKRSYAVFCLKKKN